LRTEEKEEKEEKETKIGRNYFTWCCFSASCILRHVSSCLSDVVWKGSLC
jgi:hypothetical protein